MNQKRKPARRKPVNRARGRKNSNLPFLIGAAALVIVLVLVIALVRNSGSSSSSGALRSPAPAALVAKVRGVTDATINTVGQGSVTTAQMPTPSKDTSPLTKAGKPEMLYLGAEYCPYCATERWAMVNALSRFGTFTGLNVTRSSASDQPASIPTFSFYQSTYTSQYLAFTSIETQTNKFNGSTYGTLETPTAAQSAIVTANDPNGSIPFIDIGGKYITTDATYDFSVLQGKTWDEIAAELTNSATTKGVVGAANAITAAICKVTNNKPTNVCTQPAIAALQTKLS
jgi:thiol-disulfide isomerase/thioredoxin